MVATWGAISWRGTRAVGKSDRAVHAIRQHRNARRHVERLVGCVYQRRRLPITQPEGALPPVARRPDRQRRRPGAHVGHGRLPAAQPPAAGPLDHRAPAGHRLPEAVHRPANPTSPASTIRRRRIASSPPPRRRRRRAPSAPSLGRRTYQKGLQTLVWKADDENDDDLMYDVLYRREGETTWKTLRKALTEPILVWDTTTVPNGTYFVRIVASDAPSNPAGTALSGELDSPRSRSTTRRRRSRLRAPVSTAAEQSSPSTSRTITRRFSASSSRRTASAGAACSRPTASPTPRRSTTSWRSRARSAERGLTLRASDSMNNVATAHVDAAKRK